VSFLFRERRQALATLSGVMRGPSRSKNGVLSHAYDPRIYDEVQYAKFLRMCSGRCLMDGRVKPGHDSGGVVPPTSLCVAP
jgi:hypothetical protein